MLGSLGSPSASKTLKGPGKKPGLRQDSKGPLVIASPILVLIAGHIVARTASGPMGEAAWLPLALVYWAMLGIFVLWGTNGASDVAAFSEWFGPSRGPRLWTALALVVGLIPLPILLLNLHLLTNPALVTAWLGFALVNPLFEEAYWRGLLLEATRSWPPWVSIAYSTALFAAGHPVMWGVFSVANRDWMTIVSLVVMGAVWAVAYKRTKTLRWTVLSHFLVDIGNLSVFVFLNLYVPPHL